MTVYLVSSCQKCRIYTIYITILKYMILANPIQNIDKISTTGMGYFLA